MMGTECPEDYLLYLPLSYDGDLTERVSRSRNWIVPTSSNMVWDNAEYAYLFSVTSTDTPYINGLSLPGAWAYRGTTKRICECDIKLLNISTGNLNGNNNRVSLFGMTDYTSSRTYGDNFLHYSNNAQYAGGVVSLHRWCHIKIIQNCLDVDFYTDGIQTGSVTYNNNTTPMVPDNLIPFGARWGADIGGKAYLKNIKIYQY